MKIKDRLREYLPVLLTAVLLLAARSSLADHYVVPSGSMEPTLAPGDRVLVDKRAHGLRVPFTRLELAAGARVERGEVVVFDSPDQGMRLIKRVVAVGPDLPEARVPEGHLLMLGDARSNSRDGRWFGFVREDEVYARALGVYFRSGEGLVWLPL